MSVTVGLTDIIFYRLFLSSFPSKFLLDDESPTSTDLGNDHGFITREYSLHWYEAGSPKQSHESFYAQSGQYHTIVESRVHSNSKTCLLDRGFHTLLKNVSFPSPTDVGLTIHPPSRPSILVSTCFLLQSMWDHPQSTPFRD